MRGSDQFCTQCGHELATDHMPARLRVLGESSITERPRRG
jgi:hypothetical protein